MQGGGQIVSLTLSWLMAARKPRLFDRLAPLAGDGFVQGRAALSMDKMPFDPMGRTPVLLILRRFLNMIDDEDFHRPFCRFQLQPELLLKRGEN